MLVDRAVEVGKTLGQLVLVVQEILHPYPQVKAITAVQGIAVLVITAVAAVALLKPVILTVKDMAVMELLYSYLVHLSPTQAVEAVQD